MLPEIAYLLIIDSSYTKTFINLIQTSSIFYNVLNNRDKNNIKINSTIRTRITHPNGLIICYLLPNNTKHGSYICRYITDKSDKRLEYGNFVNDKIDGRWIVVVAKHMYDVVFMIDYDMGISINKENEVVYNNTPILTKEYYINIKPYDWSYLSI